MKSRFVCCIVLASASAVAWSVPAHGSKAELPTWEKIYEQTLLEKHEECVAVIDAQDRGEDVAEHWSCNNFYNHEDAYPALQLAIRIIAGKHKQNLLRLPMLDDKKEAVENCPLRAKEAYRLGLQYMDEISGFADELFQEAVKIFDAKEAKIAGRDVEVPEPSDLLNWIEDLDVSMAQLGDVRNLFQYPMIQDRVKDGLDYLFFAAITHNCEKVVQRVLDEHSQQQEGKSNDEL